MIRIEIAPEELKEKINTARESWEGRAVESFEECRAADGYAGGDIWGEIKEVYIELQHHKCAYCESPMAAGRGMKIDYDVEHFRPKSSVKSWEDYKAGRAGGYWWLAHCPLNYVVSCKVCNSPLKGDRFPIEGTPAKGPGKVALALGRRSTVSGDWTAAIRAMNKAEKPLLIFPLGDVDDDPADLIRFHGMLGQPRAKSGAKKKRAEVTLEFFGLNGPREDIMVARAMTIDALFDKLELAKTRTGAAAERLRAEALQRTRPDRPHSACARDFVALYEANIAKATQVAGLAKDFLASMKL